MIDNGLKPLAPVSGVIRPGVNLVHGSIPVAVSTELVKGQLVEVVVVQLQPRLLVETPNRSNSALNTKLPAVIDVLLQTFWQLPNTRFLTPWDTKQWLLMSGLLSVAGLRRTLYLGGCSGCK